MKKVEKILEDMALSLHNGEICVRPSYSKSTASPYNDVCQYCDYKEVCGLDDDTKKNEIDKLKHEESLAELGGEDDA